MNYLPFFNGLKQKPQYLETKNEINVLPEDSLEFGNEIDVSDVPLDSFSPYKEQNVKKDVPSSNIDQYTDHSEMLHDLTSAQNKRMVNQETQTSSTADDEIGMSELLNNLFSQKDKGVTVVPTSTNTKTNSAVDVSELFRDLISGPEKQLREQETKAPSHTEEEMLHDLLPQMEQEMKMVPKSFSKSDEKIEFLELLNNIFSQKDEGSNLVTKSNSAVDVSEFVSDLNSEPEEQEKSENDDFSKSENDIDILELLNDLVSAQNEDVVEVSSMASSKIEKELDMPDLVIEMIPSPKESEESIIIEIDEEIISIMPLNDSTTDEKKENLPKPNLTTKMNELLSDIISPLEQRLLDEFERALVPLNDIIELGADIKNSPFTEEEIKKLGLFKVYMETTQELHSEFKSRIHAFGVNRFYETAVHTHYHLSEKQKNHAINVLNVATERVKAESKAIYDLILKTENQQLIKSIENKKLELSASLRAISLSLKAKYAHLIVDDKMEDVKTKRLSIIEENSKSMIELLQSKALESLKDGIIEHVDKLVDIMNKLPMKITLSYMF